MHGVTGFHASTPAEAAVTVRYLVDDPELRQRVGAAAKEYILTYRTSEIAAPRWYEVCCAAVEEYTSLNQLRLSTN